MRVGAVGPMLLISNVCTKHTNYPHVLVQSGLVTRTEGWRSSTRCCKLLTRGWNWCCLHRQLLLSSRCAAVCTVVAVVFFVIFHLATLLSATSAN
jgi:hypothetical protein